MSTSRQPFYVYYDRIRAYLSEKCIDVTPYPTQSPRTSSLIINNVKPRMWSQVVLPAIRQILETSDIPMGVTSPGTDSYKVMFGIPFN